MKKLYILNFVGLFVFLLFVTGCDINIPNDGEYGDTVLRGKVVDKADSTPLDSVLFTLAYSKVLQNTSYKELSPKTDSTGTFYFDIYCMQDYSYRLYFEKDGYSPNHLVTFPLTIDSGKDNYFYIEMIKMDSTRAK